MTDLSGIIHACSVKGDGTGTILSGEDITKEIKHDRLAWVHLDATNPKTREWLNREINYLDQIILDALLANETRPRIVEFEEGVLLILRGVNLNENAQPQDMVSIRLWIDQSRIVSIQRRNLKAISDMQERLLSGNGPKNSGDFLAMLINRLFERMEPILGRLDERTDNVEERVSEEPDATQRQELVDIRKQAIIFRRYIVPQRDAISSLKSSELKWLDTVQRRKLQESLDRIMRYVEDLDTVRERAQIIKDELTNALADKMNRNMYMLSVVAAIFLPLGFLTGLLGINIAGIPGADYPYAFWVFMAMMIGVVMCQIAVFKKLKWF